MKSANTERAPIQRPPKAAAVGMYLFSSWIMEVSLCPLITIYTINIVKKSFSTVDESHLLFSQLFGHILGRAARHINPGLAEEGAGSEHEGDVEDGVDGVGEHGGQGLGGTEIVAESTHWVGATTSSIIPHSQQIDKEVTSELDTEHLRDHVEVGDQGGLEDDGYVGGVEELDGVAAVLTSVPGALDRQVHSESLEVDHHTEDEDGGEQVHQVGQVLSVESFSKSSHLVLSRGQEMEESNHSSLELSSSASVDSGG